MLRPMEGTPIEGRIYRREVSLTVRIPCSEKAVELYLPPQAVTQWIYGGERPAEVSLWESCNRATAVVTHNKTWCHEQEEGIILDFQCLILKTGLFFPYFFLKLSHSLFYSFIIYSPHQGTLYAEVNWCHLLGKLNGRLEIGELGHLQEIFFKKLIMDDTNVQIQISLASKCTSHS